MYGYLLFVQRFRDFQLKKYSIPAGRYANALSAEEAEEEESATMERG